MIPYGRQSISEEDIAAVVAVLRSDLITQGPAIDAFELAVSKKVGVDHAVASNSATSSLHIACLALDVGPGDAVWTSPNSFVASSNAALYCGAQVDFVDIDPTTLCISVEALSAKLQSARQQSKQLPKVVIPVHFGGQSCDMARIRHLGAEYGFKIIEDASHAIGATYQNFSNSPCNSPVKANIEGEFSPVGNCEHADICVFSFHPVKIITTGEGGMGTTQCPELAERMREFRSHGITRKADRMTTPSHGPWYYQMTSLGFNYRMTDIAAALGLSQLSRLNEFVEKRRSVAQRYDEHFASNPKIRLQQVPSYTRSAKHLYVVRVPQAQHLEIFETLRSKGIGVNLHYIPIHLQPFYKSKGFQEGQFPQAELYYREAISLPIYPGLSDDDQSKIIGDLLEALR